MSHSSKNEFKTFDWVRVKDRFSQAINRLFSDILLINAPVILMGFLNQLVATNYEQEIVISS